MAGKIISLTVSITFLFACSAWGMTVADPTSYVYFVEQIKQKSKDLTYQVEQLTQLQETYEKTQEVLEEVEETKKQMMGHYNRGNDLVQRLHGLYATFNTRPSTLEDQAKKWLSLGEDVRDFAGAENVIDDLFHDPREKSAEAFKSLDKIYGVRQKALKKAIAEADITVGSMGDRLKALGELTEMVDKTENVKDATDLTNRVLLEILQIQIEQLNLIAQLGQASALMQFTGVTDEVQKEKVTVKMVKEFEPPHNKRLREMGIDPNDLSDQVLFDIIDGKYRK